MSEEKKRYFVWVTEDEDNGYLHELTQERTQKCALYNVKFGSMIEITEAELPYMERPEGSWTFKRPEVGETIKQIAGWAVAPAISDLPDRLVSWVDDLYALAPDPCVCKLASFGVTDFETNYPV